jgi:pyrroline-5-carboxylate reductase
MLKRNSDSNSVAIIGAGNLGSAIAKRLVQEIEVIVTGRRKEILNDLRDRGCEVEKSNTKAASKADFVFITVKPKDVDSVLEEIKGEVKDKKVVSFAAMKKFEEIKKSIPNSFVFRAMTNVFAEKGLAFTVYYPAYDEELERILSILGEVHLVKTEKEVDLMTAFSGSAPAFVAKLIQGFVYAGLSCGLNAEMAKKVTLSIFSGTANALKEKESENLIKEITTPGGTTIQGIKKLEENRVEFAIMEAMEATARKALG